MYILVPERLLPPTHYRQAQYLTINATLVCRIENFILYNNVRNYDFCLISHAKNDEITYVNG